MPDIKQIKTLNGTVYNIKDTTARATMTGATATTAGTKGQVPAPAAGDQEKFLKADGSWAEVEADTGAVSVNSTILASGWNNGQVTVGVDGMTNIANAVVGIAATATTAQREAAGLAQLYVASQGTNTITIKANGDVPTIDIPITTLLFAVGGYEPISGGHVIVDDDGTEFDSRSKLQFINATITDDSTNDATVVELSGGHTIVNSDDTEYTKRSKLKFLNATITDDATNDETVIDALRPSGRVIYGLNISGSESNPSSKVIYLEDAVGMTPAHMDFTSNTFSYGSWENAFFMPKPCMVKYDGTVDYYLDPNNYNFKEDGVTASDVANTSYAGNAMMEWGGNGHIWMKIVPVNSTSANIYIANYQADANYHDWPFHNALGNRVDHFYTPIYNGSLISSKLRSISGQQVMNTKTAQQEIDYAKANNQTSTEIWNTECKSDIDLINVLVTLMFKTTDLQTALGQGLTTGGSESINNGFRTGVHNTKGLFYGTNSGTATTYSNAVKVFGMENWYAFIWRRYRGHIVINGLHYIKNTYGKEDGSTVSGYNLTGSGYKQITSSAISGTSGGYISTQTYTDSGIVSTAVSGSSSTHYADGHWFNNTITSVPLRGAASVYGSLCGLWAFSSDNVASSSAWAFGAALSCKPLA